MMIVNRLRGADNPTTFFKTEAEGRKWIEERRRALRSVSPAFQPAKK